MKNLNSLVYLAFGANIGNKTGNIKKAVNLLHKSGLVVCGLSPFYKNAPLLPCGISGETKNIISKMYFVNALGLFKTSASPFKLLQITQKIEKLVGKKKLGHWMPRKIDIDIILYKKVSSVKVVKMQTQSLSLPHPHYKNRSFVLNLFDKIEYV